MEPGYKGIDPMIETAPEIGIGFVVILKLPARLLPLIGKGLVVLHCFQ